MNTASKNEAIQGLFHPRNVVLVGASDRAEHWSKRVLDNLQRFKFDGPVFLVNPNRDDIWGMPCFRDLGSLPERPDHLVILTPAETALRVLREGAAAGARSATLYAAGFGEGGDADGLRLAGELRETLAATGLTLVGPNCMGAACGASRFCSIPDETLQELAESPVAVVAQSGAICSSTNRAINELGLKVGYFASCGMQIGCTASDFINYYALQPELRVILCYIEGILDAAHFFAAARQARENGKTVVVVKIGGSETSRAFALAHTGSLAGSSEVFEAFAAAAGIVRVASLEDAIEAVEFLARAPLPRGFNVAAITNSGALRNLITEAADRSGAKLATLSEATQARLRGVLDQSDISNPFDTKRTIPTSQYAACVEAFIEAPEVDIIMAAEELPRDDGIVRRITNLKSLEAAAQKAATLGKPLAVFTPFIISTTEYGRAVKAEISHVPVLRDLERALRLVRTLAETGTRAIHTGDFFAPPADHDLARRWRARAAQLERPTALNEVESKALLQAYGIPLPGERVTTSVDDARAAAREIGYPVVLKGVSAAITHKSDAGLVILDIKDDATLDRAFATLVERTAALAAPLEGVLVAQQVSGGTETVLGISRDPEMGPVVMFGLGGIFVELLKDVSFAPATLDRTQADAMVSATRAGRLIDGFRGSKPGDRDALLTALANLGRLACDLGDIIEAVDINPFLVRENGRGAFALDGLVVLRPPATAATTHPADHAP